MNTAILQTKELPEALQRLIKSQNVTIHQADGAVTLVPDNATEPYICNFRGMFKSSTSVVDEIIAARKASPRG
jgi:hypothetical protein